MLPTSFRDLHEDLRPQTALARFNALYDRLGDAEEASIEADFVVPGTFERLQTPAPPLDRLLANRLQEDRAIAVARRCGLKLVRSEDATGAARTQLDAQQPNADLHLRRDAYRQGLLRRTRLIFRRAANAPRYRLSIARHADMTAVLALFKEVFGQPMSPQLWRWKYDDAPWPPTLVWHEGELVAHYGTLPRTVIYRGVATVGCQVGDVMVRQDHRTARGPILLTGATCCELFEATESGVTWGFPNERHFLVTQLIGLYERISTLHELRFASLDAPPGRLSSHELGALPDSNQALALLHLNEAFEHDLRDAVVCERRGDYLQRRYWQRPDAQYRRHLVLRDGEVIGFIVLGRGNQGLELLDILASQSNIPDCLLTARHLAHQLGSTSLDFSITEPFDTRFRTLGGVTAGEGCVIPTPIWNSQRWVPRLKGGWWLTGGDTDYL